MSKLIRARCSATGHVLVQDSAQGIQYWADQVTLAPVTHFDKGDMVRFDIPVPLIPDFETLIKEGDRWGLSTVKGQVVKAGINELEILVEFWLVQGSMQLRFTQRGSLLHDGNFYLNALSPLGTKSDDYSDTDEAEVPPVDSNETAYQDMHYTALARVSQHWPELNTTYDRILDGKVGETLKKLDLIRQILEVELDYTAKTCNITITESDKLTKIKTPRLVKSLQELLETLKKV